jgi:nickel-dependent lactate racemase
MRIDIPYGRRHLTLQVHEQNLVRAEHGPPGRELADAGAAVQAALETPVGFPSLRRALTPDDQIAVVVDERAPHLAAVLTAVLEHLTRANVQPEAVSLVCPPPDMGQPWLEQLPAAFQEVRVEVHNPADRKRLSYLASTRHGRRIYLNRTVVDADQVVVVTRRGYDTSHGYTGAAAALYPALSDEATLQAARAGLTAKDAAKAPSPQETAEVAWLLGAPFFLQLIEGADGGLAHVLGGLAETSHEGERLLDARWRVSVDRSADVVVAGVGGDPTRHEFADLARAAANAARVVKRQGRIVLLSGSRPALGEAAGVLRKSDDAAHALRALRDHAGAQDLEAAYAWACAAEQAHIYLWSDFPAETAEELFAVPLDSIAQVERLLGPGDTCVILPDAQQSRAVLRD